MVRQEAEESHSYFGHASTSYYFTILIIRSILSFVLRSFVRKLDLLSSRRTERSLIVRYGLMVDAGELSLRCSLSHACVVVAGRGSGMTDPSISSASFSRGTVSDEDVERSEPGLF